MILTGAQDLIGRFRHGSWEPELIRSLDQLRQPRVDHGATDEKPLRSFRKRQLGRHGDRVRPDCCWYFGRDYRSRERPRHHAERQVPEHLDPAQVVEQSRANTKAPADLPEPFAFELRFTMANVSPANRSASLRGV